MNADGFSFETKLAELTAISKQLDQYNLPLNQAISLWKNGHQINQEIEVFLKDLKDKLDQSHQYGQSLTNNNEELMPDWLNDNDTHSEIPNFEDAFKNLQNIILKLESGDVLAQDLINIVQQGLRHSFFSLKHLQQSELLVQEISGINLIS